MLNAQWRKTVNYSLSLLLEKSELDRCMYIDYRNKKECKYSGIVMWDDGIMCDSFHHEEKLICIAAVSDFLEWSSETIQQVSTKYGLILVDEDDVWDVGRMQYNSSLINVSGDLIIIRDMPLVKGFNKLTSIFRSLNHIMEAFTNAVINHSDLQYIIELFFEYIGNPAYIVDSSFKVLAVDRRNDMRELSAVWRRLEDQGYLQYDIVTQMINDQELSKIEAEENATRVQSVHFNTPFINYNLRKKNKLIGHLFVVNMFKTITPGDIEICSILGKFIEKSMADNPRYQMERGRLYEYFMSDIFSGRIRNLDEIRRQMLPLKYKEDSFYIIAVIKPAEDNLSELSEERLFYLLEREYACKPTKYKDKVSILLPIQEMENIENIMAGLSKIAHNLNLYVGVSERFYGYSFIHLGMKQALVACEDARCSDMEIKRFEDCALEYLKKEIFKNKNIDMFEPPCLSMLKEYDQKNNTSLLETLKMFLTHERNIMETSKAMFIHRNTLTYRIRKIEEITRINLEDSELRLRSMFFLD